MIEIASKESMIKFVCDLFLKKGYSCTENYNLQTKTGYPYSIDIFAESKKEDNSWLIEVLEKFNIAKIEKLDYIKNIHELKDTNFAVALPKNLELTTVQKTMLTHSGIILIQISDTAQDTVFDGLEGNSVKYEEIELDKIQAIPPNQFDELKKLDYLKNRRLPLSLLDKLFFGKVAYKKELNFFVNEYRQVKDSDEENEIIQNNIENLWAGKYGKQKSAKSFLDFKIFEPILDKIEGYRDHFVHPFQVFLLGSLIIDKNYSLINSIVKKKTENMKSDTLDFTWLIASTFHDFCYPIENFKKFTKDFFGSFLQTNEISIDFDLTKFLLTEGTLNYIDQLISLYMFYYLDENGKCWQYNQKCQINQNLRDIILNDLNNRKDHGIFSAITLLKKILQEDNCNKPEYISGRFSSDIYPASLAIALHNIATHKTDEELAPIIFEKSPIIFLLIYCDTVQDWGREAKNKIDVKFKNFTIVEKEITTSVSVKTKKDFDEKLVEYRRCFNKLISSKLNFKISLTCEEDKTEIIVPSKKNSIVKRRLS